MSDDDAEAAGRRGEGGTTTNYIPILGAASECGTLSAKEALGGDTKRKEGRRKGM